jgi:ribosomal-protein-alanine acetyltransferase
MIRPATETDLPQIARIQSVSDQAALWDVRDYLSLMCRVVADGAEVRGFVVARSVASGEIEILNLAVAPEFRRQGIAHSLVRTVLENHRGECYLEVRESNYAARNLYQKLGFSEIGRRPDYYNSPTESAIVMRCQSC